MCYNKNDKMDNCTIVSFLQFFSFKEKAKNY